MLYAAFSTSSAGTVQIELSPSYVATHGQNGDIEIILTVATNRHVSASGAVATSVPMGTFFDQAAKKQCPNGYEVRNQDPLQSKTLLNVINWTQKTVIRCNGA